MTRDLGAQERLDAAFAREERRGLMLAAAARSAAVVFILGWLAVANPERGAAYVWVLGSAARAAARRCVTSRSSREPSWC